MTANKPLLCIGCFHAGHENSDTKLGKEYVKWAKKVDAHVLILGDLFEMALPNKGHMAFSQTLNPQAQLDTMTEILKPIASQVIGACTSNHSMRAYKVAGIDLDKILAERLNYLDKYMPHQGNVGVQVGRISYEVAYSHGIGVGSNSFGNCTRLSRSYPSADLCVSSHTHELATVKKGHWSIVKGKRKLNEVTYIVTGSLLDYPSYADEAMYQPQVKGFAIAWLNPREKHISVDASGRLT